MTHELVDNATTTQGAFDGPGRQDHPRRPQDRSTASAPAIGAVDAGTADADGQEGTPCPAPHVVLTDMASHVFKLFQSLVHKNSGIFLADHKRPLLVRRLRSRVSDLGLDSFLAYYRLVSKDESGDELVTMLDLVSTNETRFFRELRQLDFLEREILREWSEAGAEGSRRRNVNAWCAACSSGEEPFTLAMLLARNLPPSAGWRNRILATDLSTRILERARAATWPIRQVTDIPESYLKEYMLRGTGANVGSMRAKASLRAMIEFARLNLHLDPMPAGPFDLILCRNVLMYFDTAAKRRAIERLLSVLSPGGYLLVGHAESLSGLDPRLRLIAPTIYSRATGELAETAGTRRDRWRAFGFLAGETEAADPGEEAE